MLDTQLSGQQVFSHIQDMVLRLCTRSYQQWRRNNWVCVIKYATLPESCPNSFWLSRGMKKQGKEEQMFSSFLVLDFEATCDRGTEIRPQVCYSGLSFLRYLGFMYLMLRGISFLCTLFFCAYSFISFIYFIFHKSNTGNNLRCGNSHQFKYNSCKNTTEHNQR
jgi:hypothetical protein